jgi:flagellar basal body P-ring formation protein FlgA
MIPWVLFFSMVQPSTCELISSERILGEDLARALPAFSILPRDAVIGFSPAPGASRVFLPPELKRLGMKYGVTVADNAPVCFERKMHPLTEEAVRAAMLPSLDTPPARLEILAMSKASVPEGKLEFPPSGLSALNTVDPATPVIWNGYVLYDKGRKFAVWARIRAIATMTRVVAVEPLLPGKSVEQRQVRLETYDEFPLHNEIARNLEEVVGRVPRRAIRAGLPVLRTDLAEPFQVQRGELVRVVAMSGAAQVELEAVAETSGRQGDVITLTNPRSGKTFRARIEGKNRAVVVSGPLGVLARVQ